MPVRRMFSCLACSRRWGSARRACGRSRRPRRRWCGIVLLHQLRRRSLPRSRARSLHHPRSWSRMAVAGDDDGTSPAAQHLFHQRGALLRRLPSRAGGCRPGARYKINPRISPRTAGISAGGRREGHPRASEHLRIALAHRIETPWRRAARLGWSPPIDGRAYSQRRDKVVMPRVPASARVAPSFYGGDRNLRLLFSLRKRADRRTRSRAVRSVSSPPPAGTAALASVPMRAPRRGTGSAKRR